MDGRRKFLVMRFVLVIGLLGACPFWSRADGLEGLTQFFKGDDEPLTLKEVAYQVDCIEGKLAHAGTIGVKIPDVWGQNRMTRYRAEFELQMAQNLGQFQLILQGAQRRSDTAVLTSATSLAATVAAAGTAAPRRGLVGSSKPAPTIIPASTALPISAALPTAVGTTPLPTININTGGSGSSSSGGGSGSSAGGSSSSAASSAASATDPTALLSDISAKLAALQ